LLSNSEKSFKYNKITPFFDVVSEGGLAVASAASPVAIQRLELEPGGGDPVWESTRVWRLDRHLTGRELDLARHQDLQPLGWGSEFLAADWPLEAALILDWIGTAALDSSSGAPDWLSGPGLGVFGLGRDRWRFVQPLRTDDAEVGPSRISVVESGLFAVMSDSVAPVIERPAEPLRIASATPRTASGVTLPRWEIFAVGIRDQGSGIAPQTITVRLDDGRLITEPDLLRDRILVELPDDLPAGEHSLQISLEDEVGNVATADLTIVCFD
jgi:hypothetical protein